MIIAAFIASAAITGLLLALFARTQGIHHSGILIALGIVGGGIQMVVMIAWYLHHTSEKEERRRRAQLSDMQEPSVDRIDGR
jgi:hypothetical protein